MLLYRDYHNAPYSLEEVKESLKDIKLVYISAYRYIPKDVYIDALEEWYIYQTCRSMGFHIGLSERNYNTLYNLWSRYMIFHHTLSLNKIDLEDLKVSLNKNKVGNSSNHIHHEPKSLLIKLKQDKEYNSKGAVVKIDMLKSRTIKSSSRGN